jgi:hypothetical protein
MSSGGPSAQPLIKLLYGKICGKWLWLFGGEK